MKGAWLGGKLGTSCGEGAPKGEEEF